MDFQPLLDLNPDGLLVLRPETREILYANHSVERLLRKKMKHILAEPFPEALTEGPMQTHDLYKKPQAIDWLGEEAVFLLLLPLASQQSAFHVEWRIESAEERARDAEQRVTELEAALAEASAAPKAGPVVSQVALEELDRAREELDRAREELDRARALIAQLESQSLEFVNGLHEWRERAGASEADLLALQQKVAQHEQAEQEAYAQVRGLEDRASELQAELSRAESRLTQAEADLNKSDQRAEQAEQHCREAESLMEEAESQAQEAERHVEDLSDSLHRVEDELELSRQALKQSEEAQQRLEAENARLQAELSSAGVEGGAQLEKLHLELAEQKVLEMNLREQVEFQLANCDELQAALQEAQTGLRELEELPARLEAALADVEAGRQRHQQLLSEFSDADENMTALEARLEELTQCRDQDEKAIEAHAAEHERLLAEMATCKAERDHALAELEESRARIGGGLAELQARYEQSQADLFESRAQQEQSASELAAVQELQDELATESERADNVQALLEQSRQQQQLVEAEVEKLKADLELAAQQSELDELARQDSELQFSQLRAELKQQIEDLQLQQEQARESFLLEIEKQRLLAEDAKHQLLELEEEVEHEKAQAERSSEELASLRNRSVELEARQESDDKTLAAARAEAFALQARLQEMEDERNRLSVQIEELRHEHAAVEELRQGSAARIAELAAQLSHLEARAAEAEERANEAENLLEVAEERASVSEERLNSVNLSTANLVDEERARQLSMLEERVHEQQEELLRSSVQSQEVQERLLASEQEATALKAKLAEQAVGFQAHQEAVLEADREAQALRARAELAEGQLAALRALEGQISPVDQQRVTQLEQAVEEGHQRLQQAAQVALTFEERALKAEQQLAQAAPAGEAPAVDPETEQLAFQDGLTGLPNLNLLKRYLDFALQQTNRYQRNSALFYIDLDRFQLLNETLGTQACNEILLQVAERLQTVVRGSDVLARKGEDEFLILLTEVSGDPGSPGSIAVVVRRLFEVFQPPFIAGGQKIHVTCSVGVSSCPGDAKDAPQMLEHSIAALRRAKQLGRARSQFYTDDVQQQFETRVGLEKELRRAIDAQEFTLLYQPIVHLPTGRLAGVETLLRWQHPVQGLLEPDHFLEVAEETGLLVVLGRWILLQACQQLCDWSRIGLDLLVTVNLSQRQFLQADLADTLQRTLEVTGAPAHSLVVEIPESVQMLDPDRLASVVNQLRKLGVQVALDHFGSGFSSLERLNVNLASILKLDRKFVRAIPQNPTATAVVTAGIVLAKSLRLKPIAVGVENEAQLSLCRQMGCDFVQGNLIYVPVPGSQVAELSKSGRLLFPG